MDIASMRQEITRILGAIDAVSETLHEEELQIEYDPDNTLCMINRRIEDAFAALCEVDDLLLEM
jgi:hypothetical protein